MILKSSHLHLMAHWAGQGSPVMFLLGRSVKMDQSGASSKTYMSVDYGKTFQDISHRFKVDNNTNALIVKFYHHPKVSNDKTEHVQSSKPRANSQNF